MKRWIMAIAVFCFSAVLPLHPQEQNIALFPFKAPKYLAVESSRLYLTMHEEVKGKSLFSALPDSAAAKLWYSYSQGTASKQDIARYKSLAKSLNCTHILSGQLTSTKNEKSIEARLYEAKTNAIVYMTSETVARNGSMESAAQVVLLRVSLFLRNALPRLSSLAASQGTEKDSIVVSWKCAGSCDTYTVLRSKIKSGPYEEIDTLQKDSFRDNSPLEGIKYWYKVVPKYNAIIGDPGIISGFIKPNNPQSLTVNEITDSKNKPKERASDPMEQQKQQRHLKLMEEYYEGYITMSFIFLVGKMYINRGELIAYKDFSQYTYDRQNKTILLIKPSALIVKFYSDRFFRFVRDMGAQSIPEEELLPRLVRNSLVFCIRNGEQEYTDADGFTRILPLYEAAGLATEYFRDYSGWRSNSIVFGTSDKELSKRIQEAKKRGR